MTETYQVIAQLTPSASSQTTAYTVPAATSATISSIVICNTNNTATTFSVAVQIAGASISTQQYLYYNLPIAAYDTFIATIGITLATTDVISVVAGNTNVAFNIFGVQIQ